MYMSSRFLLTMIVKRKLQYQASVTVLVLFTVLFAIVTEACVREEDITLEQRAHQLSGELMCPVCDGQTIDGSNAQIAVDMRLKVKYLLEEGNTNAEILDYFSDRYGDEILAAPTGTGLNMLAWIFPALIVTAAIGIALYTIKNMKRSSLNNEPKSSSTGNISIKHTDLSEYLDRVDQDLGIKKNPSIQAKQEQKDEEKT